MKMAIFTFLFMGLASKAAALYSPEKAIRDAQNLSVPSVESFLATVPADFAAQSMILFGSQSNQQADLLNPRIPIFNENMVMTFNGHGFGSDEVEMIRFNVNTKTFDFYALVFQNGKLDVQENPKRCFSCHTEKAPLWFSASIHPFWPGVFGSGTAMATKPDEESALAKFIEAAKKSERYKILFPQLEKVVPYFSDNKDAISLFERNGKFELQLADWMAQFTFQKLQSEPLFKSMRPALLAVLSCVFNEIPQWKCKKTDLIELLDSLVPQHDSKWKENFSLYEIIVENATNAASKNKWEHLSSSISIPFKELMNREKAFKGASPVSEKHTPITAGLLIIEQLFYQQRLAEGLSMSPLDQQFEYAGIIAPWGVLGRLEQLLFQSLVQDHPDLNLQALRKTHLQKLSTIGAFSYSTWNSAELMEITLRHLYELDNKPFYCEYILTEAANDQNH